MSAVQKGFKEGFRKLNENDWKLIAQYEQETGLEVQEIEETSAGCIVFSRNLEGKVVFMMIEQEKDWYNFPKGHLDDGEDNLAAAIRETLEETNVSVRPEEVNVAEPIITKYSLTCKLHSNLWVKHPDYPDNSKRPLVIGHKTVTFYCAFIPVMQEGIPQDGEALSVKWFTIDEANAIISEVIRERWEKALETNFVQKLISS